MAVGCKCSSLHKSHQSPHLLDCLCLTSPHDIDNIRIEHEQALAVGMRSFLRIQPPPQPWTHAMQGAHHSCRTGWTKAQAPISVCSPGASPAWIKVYAAGCRLNASGAPAMVFQLENVASSQQRMRSAACKHGPTLAPGTTSNGSSSSSNRSLHASMNLILSSQSPMISQVHAQQEASQDAKGLLLGMRSSLSMPHSSITCIMPCMQALALQCYDFAWSTALQPVSRMHPQHACLSLAMLTTCTDNMKANCCSNDSVHLSLCRNCKRR